MALFGPNFQVLAMEPLPEPIRLRGRADHRRPNTGGPIRPWRWNRQMIRGCPGGGISSGNSRPWAGSSGHRGWVTNDRFLPVKGLRGQGRTS